MENTKLTQDEVKEFLSIFPDKTELEALERNLIKDFNPERFIEAHKKDLEILKETNQTMKRLTNLFEEGGASRASLEKVYTTKINLLLRSARRFHPLSTYGRETLQRAVSTRRRFEELVGELVTNVTPENIELFEPLMPKDLCEEISVGKCHAIGGLRNEPNGIYGVGILVYNLEKISLDDSLVMRIKWLFVDEGWRGKGIGNFLLGEIINSMIENDVDGMTIDFSIGKDADTVGHLLTDWHFSFATGLTPEFVCRLSDIRDPAHLIKYGDKATSFRELSDNETRSLIRRSFDDNHYQGYLYGIDADREYFEKEMSCFTGSYYQPDSMTLVHRCPSGTLRVEYFAFMPGKEKEIIKLVGCLAVSALNKYPRTTFLFMPIESEQFGMLLDRLFPNQRTKLLIEGVLLDIPEELDLDEEDVEEMILSSY